MSLTKAIEPGKERRKQYRDDRIYSVRSRNHGAYAWEFLGVKYKDKKCRLRGCDDAKERPDDFADIFAELG